MNQTRPPNENATAGDRGARTDFPAASNARPGASGKTEQDYETRRNAAACFKNPRKTEEWMPDFVGVAVVEGLGDGDKVWINVREKVTRKGERYLSVTIKRQKS
jgi:hypothetical protein